MSTGNGSLKICFGTTCHIPQNSENGTAEEVYRQAFKPLASTLYNLPEVPFTVHLTGNMIDWLERRHSEFFMILEEMNNRKQLEFLGGGYYNPLFPLLPPADRVGQIELLTTALRRHFGKRPRGAWLPASAWDSSLISALSTCGMEYTLIDTRMMEASPVHAPLKTRCMTTEDGGKTLTLVPLDQTFASPEDSGPEELYRTLLGLVADGSEREFAVFFAQESLPALFGSTDNQPCWFSRFVSLAANSGGVIEFTTPGKLQKNRLEPARVYVSPGMSPCVVENLIKPSGPDQGGSPACNPALFSPKHLLQARPEALRLYAKMMYVHLLVNQLRGDKSRKKNAREELWRAQDCDVWFPQTRHPAATSLRSLAYKSLIVAEKTTRVRGLFFPSLSTFDFDLDGLKEYLCQLEHLNLYIHQYGGKLFELDVLGSNRNYCDLAGLADGCSGQTETEGLFVDHFLSDEDLETCLVNRCTRVPNGVFAENLYQETAIDSTRYEVSFRTNGHFGQFQQPLSLRKQYSFRNGAIQVQYILKNESPINLSGYFMTELDLALPAGEGTPTAVSLFSQETRIEVSPDFGTWQDVAWIQIDDTANRVKFTIEANENPSVTIASIGCTDKCQGAGSCGLRVLLYWKTELGPGYETEKMLFVKIDN